MVFCHHAGVHVGLGTHQCSRRVVERWLRCLLCLHVCWCGGGSSGCLSLSMLFITVVAVW